MRESFDPVLLDLGKSFRPASGPIPVPYSFLAESINSLVNVIALRFDLMFLTVWFPD